MPPEIAREPTCETTESLSDRSRFLPLPNTAASNTSPFEEPENKNPQQNEQSTVPESYPVSEMRNPLARSRRMMTLASRWALSPSLPSLKRDSLHNTIMSPARVMHLYLQMAFPYRPPTRMCTRPIPNRCTPIFPLLHFFLCLLNHKKDTQR